MTVYYRSECVLITHRAFHVRCPERQTFPLCDLSDLCVLEGRRATPVRVMVGSSGLAGVAAVAVATRGFDIPTPLALLAGGVLLATAALTSACVQPSKRQYELHARHQGVPVVLFAAGEPAFGQVKRALVRALEQSAEG